MGHASASGELGGFGGLRRFSARRQRHEAFRPPAANQRLERIGNRDRDRKSDQVLWILVERTAEDRLVPAGEDAARSGLFARVQDRIAGLRCPRGARHRNGM